MIARAYAPNPVPGTARQVLGENSPLGLGVDLERECWAVLMALRCESWLDGYGLALAQRAASAGRESRTWETLALLHTERPPEAGMLLDEHITGVYLAHSELNAEASRKRKKEGGKSEPPGGRGRARVPPPPDGKVS